MLTFIDQQRERFGVESIGAVLPIAPSTHFRWKAQQREPTRRSPRAQRDELLRTAIRRVWDAHFAVYGVRKVWRQLRREGVEVARSTVQRLMCDMGLAGACRGRAWVTTTQPAVTADHPRDLRRDWSPIGRKRLAPSARKLTTVATMARATRSTPKPRRGPSSPALRPPCRRPPTAQKLALVGVDNPGL